VPERERVVPERERVVPERERVVPMVARAVEQPLEPTASCDTWDTSP